MRDVEGEGDVGVMDAGSPSSFLQHVPVQVSRCRYLPSSATSHAGESCCEVGGSVASHRNGRSACHILSSGLGRCSTLSVCLSSQICVCVFTVSVCLPTITMFVCQYLS